MVMTVLDTAHGMSNVLAVAEPSRRAALSRLLTPMRDMYRYFPGEPDLVALHEMSFGFPLDRPTDVLRDALDSLVQADAWGRIERALTAAVEVQAAAVPDLVVPDISTLLILGNPDDEYFMGPARGFSGNGSMTGFITLTLWPTEENLERLEAAAVHELHHNLRYAPGGVVWDPATVQVGEQVISEGLADAFARQLHGALGYTPIGLPHLEDDDVLTRMLAGLDVAGMDNFAAWVHGDDAARRFGAEPVGVPTGAGYAVGNRMVDAYLSSTGTAAADALHMPSRDIIDIARRAFA